MKYNNKVSAATIARTAALLLALVLTALFVNGESFGLQKAWNSW